MTPGPELVVAVGPSREETQPELTATASAEDLREERRRIVITDHEVVPRPGVDRQPCVAQVSVDDTWFVRLVVVDPQLDRRFS
ncbi:MAG: hypothetical protein NVSMB4_19600 [Acidimicrobiales bacterium]